MHKRGHPSTSEVSCRGELWSQKREQHRSLTHDFQEDGQVDDSLCGRPMSGGGGVDKEACAAMDDAT